MNECEPRVKKAQQDGLGSTMQLTDASGAVTDSYAYDAFGAMTHPTGTNPQPFGYAGQQQDVGAEGGMLYLRARAYDPALGRFLTQDPLPFAQRYAYAGGDPVNLVDPSGLCELCDIGSGLAHGTKSLADKAVDQLPSEKAIIAGVEIGSLVVLEDCGIADATGLGEATAELSGPICGAAALAYAGAFTAQLALADSAHERIVVIASLGLSDPVNEILAPLADPHVAESASRDGKEAASVPPISQAG